MDICLRKRLWPVANQRHITVDPVSRSAPIDTVRCIVVLLSLARKKQTEKKAEEKRRRMSLRYVLHPWTSFETNRVISVFYERTTYSRDAHSTYICISKCFSERRRAVVRRVFMATAKIYSCISYLAATISYAFISPTVALLFVSSSNCYPTWETGILNYIGKLTRTR